LAHEPGNHPIIARLRLERCQHFAVCRAFHEYQGRRIATIELAWMRTAGPCGSFRE